MRVRWRSVLVLTLIPLLSLVMDCNRKPAATPWVLASSLPQAGEAGKWRPSGVPQLATAETLFELIDGGAEIYQEYGFKKAVYQAYTNAQGKSINLELYEMADPAAAYGMYTFKSSGQGRPQAIGQAASLESYYLNCWKGNCLITVVGFDSELDTLDGLVALARAAAGKIEGTGERPSVIKLFDGEGFTNVKYLRGPLALLNQNAQAVELVMKFKEAVAATVPDGQLIMLVYSSPVQCQQAFIQARQQVKNKKEVELKDGGTVFTIKNPDGHSVQVETVKAHLLIFSGKEDQFREEWLIRLKRKLD